MAKDKNSQVFHTKNEKNVIYDQNSTALENI